MDAISTKPLYCNFRFRLSIPKTTLFSSSTSTSSKKSSISLYCKNPESKPSLVSFLSPLLGTRTWGSSEQYLQSGAIGVALMSVSANAKVRISPVVARLGANPTFVAGLLALLIAQWMKVVLNFVVERRWDLRILWASGGMPSSHSALCTALTTSVALCHGLSDPLFPVCLGFSLIVMFDATGVRRHAGIQAQVLNMIVEDLFQGHPISQRKLKELLGHTPSQVFAGAVLGIVVAYICCRSFLV